MIADVLKTIVPLTQKEESSCNDWISRAEAAKIIGCDPIYIGTLVSRNLLRHYKRENGMLFVSKSEVIDYMKSKTIRMGEADDWIDSNTASTLTGYAPSYFQYLAKNGKIHAFRKERGRIYVSKKEVVAYATKRKRAASLDAD